ncbi:MAG: hypothetical protein AAF938_05345 [Myxococcota bacterium]
MKIRPLAVLFSILLLAACGDDAAPVDAGDAGTDVGRDAPAVDRGAQEEDMRTSCDPAPRCDGEDVVRCVDGEDVRRPCGEGTRCEAGVCECDLVTGDGVCAPGCEADGDCATCTPVCALGQCGDDGCGGDCGGCAASEYCGGGFCFPIPAGAVCDESCPFAGDGECDDGGPGSDFEVCALGTDCGDCGPRTPPMDGGMPDAGVPDASTPDAGVPDEGMPDEGTLDAGPDDAGRPLSCVREDCGERQFCFFEQLRCVDAARYSLAYESASGEELSFSRDLLDPRPSAARDPFVVSCSTSEATGRASLQVRHDEPGVIRWVLSATLEDWDGETGESRIAQLQFVDTRGGGRIYELDDDPECEIVALSNDPEGGMLAVSTTCTLADVTFPGDPDVVILFDALCTNPLD